MSLLMAILTPRVKTPYFTDYPGDLENIPRGHQIVVGDGALCPMLQDDKDLIERKNRVSNGKLELAGKTYVQLPVRYGAKAEIPLLKKPTVPVHIMMRQDLVQALSRKHWFLSADGYLAYGKSMHEPVLLVTGSFREAESSLRLWKFEENELKSIEAYDIAGTNERGRLKAKLGDIMEAHRESEPDIRIHLAYPVSDHMPANVQKEIGAQDIGDSAIKMASPKPYRLKKASSSNNRKLAIGFGSALLGLGVWAGLLLYGYMGYQNKVEAHERYEQAQHMSEIYSASLLDELESKKRFLGVDPIDSDRMAKFVKTIEAFSAIPGIYLKRIEFIGSNSSEYYNAEVNPKRELEYDFTVRFEVEADTQRASLEQLKGLLMDVSATAPTEELFNLRSFSRTTKDAEYREYDVGGRLCKQCQPKQEPSA